MPRYHKDGTDKTKKTITNQVNLKVLEGKKIGNVTLEVCVTSLRKITNLNK